MQGLMYLLGFSIWLVVIPAVLGLVVWRWAKKRGKPRSWGWGLAAALAIPVWTFWDYYPTKWTHEYYCEREAGFWVYKTLDQWKAENPGVMETLIYKRDMPNLQTPYGRAIVLNQRFLHIYRYEGPLLFNRWRIETEIRDSNNGEVIAREINFSTSQQRRQAGWTGWKFWLDSEHCNIENHRDQGSFDQVTAQVEGAKQ